MPKLKTEIDVGALLRRAQSGGAFAAILQKGDPQAGAYMVITRADDALHTYKAARNMNAQRVWWPRGPFTQESLDIYVNRCIAEDPDLWVVEIEDRHGRHFLVEPVEAPKTQAEPSAQDAAAQAAIKALFPTR